MIRHGLKISQAFLLMPFFALSLLFTGCQTTAPPTQQASSELAKTPAASDFNFKKIQDDDTLREWIAYYYIHRRSDLVPEAMRYMAAHDYLKSHPDIATAFFSKVFAQNHDKLSAWLSSWEGLDQTTWSVILVSLYFTGDQTDLALLNKNLFRTAVKDQKRIKDMLGQEPEDTDLLKMTVMDPRQINLLWAAFSATGDDNYIHRVIHYVKLYGNQDGSGDSDVGEAALVTLANNTLLHEQVAKICIAEQESNPDPKTKALLQAMLSAVAEIAQQSDDSTSPYAH